MFTISTCTKLLDHSWACLSCELFSYGQNTILLSSRNFTIVLSITSPIKPWCCILVKPQIWGLLKIRSCKKSLREILMGIERISMQTEIRTVSVGLWRLRGEQGQRPFIIYSDKDSGFLLLVFWKPEWCWQTKRWKALCHTWCRTL